METALLGCALPLVIQKLQEMLIRKGFRIQTVREHTTIILAFQDGTWYRSPKQVVLELSPIEDSITRVDVTAIIEARKKDPIAEEVMEENIVSAIYQNFKSTT
ncbi:MAG TPA: hypothetical protein PLU53_13245 [Bacteroidia bacterium]|nr:hypothetical protein [Bacteroidia bacterium]